MIEWENYPELTEDQQIATSIMIGFVQEVFAATDPLKLVQQIKDFDEEHQKVLADLIDTATVVIETHWEVKE